MKIEQSTLDAIKGRSLQVFERYCPDLRKKGNSYICRCPFHEEKEPSFAIRAEGAKQWQWKCFACDVKGNDVFSFVAQMERKDITKDFPDIVKIAASLCGVYVSEDSSTTATTPRTTKVLIPKAAPPQEPPIYFNDQVKTMAAEVEKTALFAYLCRYWSNAEVKRVMADYWVGLAYYIQPPNTRYNHTPNYELSATPMRLQNTIRCSAFPSIDTDGNAHAVKSIPYPDTDHHRIKGAQKDRPEIQWQKPQQNKGAFFGTHLLPLRPAAPIALAESEKTALIGALFAPEYVWIATQSKTAFDPTSSLFEPMRGRAIHIFPDTDGLTEWKAKAAALTERGYNAIFRDEVIKILPPESKADIADVIIWEMERGVQP